MGGNKNPSGANYSPRQPGLSAAPKWTISERYEPSSGSGFPGPGEYDIPYDFAQRSLSVRVRCPTTPYATPGPGTYETAEPTGARSPKTVIRECYTARPPARGIGYDKIPREFDRLKQRTIHPWTGPGAANENPGPCDYLPNVKWHSDCGHTLSPRNGRGGRTSWIPHKDSPGPAVYTPDDRPQASRAPKYSITAENGGLTGAWIGPSYTKGPAQYSPDHLAPLATEPSFTIRPKTFPRHSLEIPSESQEAGYVRLVNFPYAGPQPNIHPKEYLDLIPK
jgi:hypothetical protein